MTQMRSHLQILGIRPTTGSFSLKISEYSSESRIVWTLRLHKNVYKHVLNIAIFGLPADSTKENPYEDIELESQCSQQSLPSSPGADTTKVPAILKPSIILYSDTTKVY